MTKTLFSVFILSIVVLSCKKNDSNKLTATTHTTSGTLVTTDRMQGEWFVAYAVVNSSTYSIGWTPGDSAIVSFVDRTYSMMGRGLFSDIHEYAVSGDTMFNTHPILGDVYSTETMLGIYMNSTSDSIVLYNLIPLYGQDTLVLLKVQ